MPVDDPRARHDDLLLTESRERVSPARFDTVSESEAARSGWVVLAFAFDETGRVLLVDEPWADGWLAPGGARKPDESLRDAVVRELREETGVEIDPVAPRAVDEFRFVNDDTGETCGWEMVFFEAEASNTQVADDPGLADEEITDARWFDGLPEKMFNPDLTRRAYRRCLDF